MRREEGNLLFSITETGIIATDSEPLFLPIVFLR